MDSAGVVTPMPWHQEALQSLDDRRTLHHGMLLCGEPGIGKREFSVCLGRLLLCMNDVPLTCNASCQSCALFDAGTHPDFHLLCSEYETVNGRLPLLAEYSNRYQDIAARERKTNPSVVIPVDQVRLLIDRFMQSSHISTNRVALIVAADRMNNNAANALLKLLEEPPEDSFLILVTAEPELLPATVRSRCLTIGLAEPAREQAVEWLAGEGQLNLTNARLERALTESVGGPLDLHAVIESGALGQQQDNIGALLEMLRGRQQPIALAAAMAKQDILPLLEWLQQVATDLIRWQAAAHEPMWLDAATGPPPDIGRVSPAGLFALYGKLGTCKRMARDQLNPQLALEDILIGMQRLFRSA